MVPVGIESMNVFAGTACVDVKELAMHRRLDMGRFENLLMKEKSVALPYEDPVTFGVNAAKPIVDALSPQEKDRIELIVASTESAFDFGKSMSTYFHRLLDLNRNCRMLELKSACYSGIAGLQAAAAFVSSGASPGAKALVIATDISRFISAETEQGRGAEEWSFAEPSGGAGAVAMLVSDRPYVFRLDVGASGYYGYEVMDTCRPAPDGEAGDADLSLLSYLDCYENAFYEYCKRVPEASYADTFQYLAFHTPFGGMVKGAHRNLMRKTGKAKLEEIEADFAHRVAPGLKYCQRVGNAMGATTLLSIASVIDNADFPKPMRIGCFSYGSGCCSEFFSGIVSGDGQARLRAMAIGARLGRRYRLSMGEYERLLAESRCVKFGTRDVVLDAHFIPEARHARGAETLFLKEIRNYRREYEWIS